MSDTPTCPLSDEELLDAQVRADRRTYTADFRPHALRTIALDVVAAERARLREWFRKSHGDSSYFDSACEEVDANQRRADA